MSELQVKRNTIHANIEKQWNLFAQLTGNTKAEYLQEKLDPRAPTASSRFSFSALGFTYLWFKNSSLGHAFSFSHNIIANNFLPFISILRNSSRDLCWLWKIKRTQTGSNSVMCPSWDHVLHCSLGKIICYHLNLSQIPALFREEINFT